MKRQEKLEPGRTPGSAEGEVNTDDQSRKGPDTHRTPGKAEGDKV